MGLDWRSIPVRLESAAVRKICDDAQAWEIAVVHPPFCDLPSERLPHISRDLVACIPGEAEWGDAFPDRSYHQAEYLLDPVGYRARRTFADRERSLPYRIIRGDERFAEHATSAQGISWRCSTAAFLAEATATINRLDSLATRREFSVAEMYDLGVYKVHETDDDDDAFERAVGNLRSLARYYHQIAASGDDLIIEIW